MICKKHPKYKGLRRPRTKLTQTDGCICKVWWDHHSAKQPITVSVKKYDSTQSDSFLPRVFEPYGDTRDRDNTWIDPSHPEYYTFYSDFGSK